jgi:FSR family fosmidomycin resistance protein-like MFS transporter
MNDVKAATEGLEARAAIGGAATETEAVSPERRRFIFGIVNLSHVINHMESSAASVLYPVMMGELGFGYFAIGVLQTIYQLTAMGFQVIYGLVARLFPRAILLGFGNLFLGAMVAAAGLANNLAQLAVARGLAGVGSSVQHPVGSAILVSYFRNARGRVLTLHHSAGNLGAFMAPAVVAALLLYMDWRAVFYVLGLLSVLMGLAYFVMRDSVAGAEEAGSKKERVQAGLKDYLACLKNRNVMLVSMIQMVGAAGRGTGINVAFLTAFLMSALGVGVSTAALLLMVYQFAGLTGPLLLGWLSDRLDRKLVLQVTLVGSTLATLWLLSHQSLGPALLLNLVLYGSFIQARGSLTQSMVSDAVPLAQLDAAFSLYFFFGFISGPLWTFLMGWMIDAYGFPFAFRVISVSYLAGVLLVSLTRRPAAS